MAFKFEPEKVNEGNAGLGKSLTSIKAAEGKISECKAGLDSRINVDIPDVGEEAGKIGTCSRAIGNIYMAFKVANSKTNKTAESLKVGDTVTVDVDKDALAFGIASNAYDASKGDFIPEENVFNEYWADEKGQLQFTKREDGTYLITKNGIPMGYTDQEGFDSVYNATSKSKSDNQKESETPENNNQDTNITLDSIERKLNNNEELSVNEVKKLYSGSYIHHMFDKDFNKSRDLVQKQLNSPTWDKMSEKIKSGEKLTNEEQYKLYMANSTPIELQNPNPGTLNKAQEAMVQNAVHNGEVETFLTGTRGEWTGYDFLLDENNNQSKPAQSSTTSSEKGITNEDIQRQNLPY